VDDPVVLSVPGMAVLDTSVKMSSSFDSSA
jgi:hypothetical protein